MEAILLYLSLTLLSFLVAFKLILKTRTTRPKHLPPSPPSLPIIGHLHIIKKPFHRTFHALSQKYGQIFSLKFGSQLVVIVSSPSTVEECFTKNDIVLANRPPFLLGKHVAYNNTSLVQSPYGDHWRNLRRISTLEIFSNNRLNNFAKVELQSMLLEMTFNNIMRMVVGKRYYRYELTRFGGASNPTEFVPILRWMDYGGLEKKLKSPSKRTDEFLQALINEKRLKEEKGNTMIDHMLSLQKSQPEYYTDQIIKGLILVLLLVGTDTSAVTLEWAMTNLLNHPNILKKARDEINKTLRLYPAAPLLVPHMSSVDCTIGGYDVPSGTMLLVNAWAIHRDPMVWDDATSFKLERFENGESEGHKLMPFGIGRRTCPGASLTQRTVSLTLGSLIQCFEWERVTTEELDIDEGTGLTMTKAMPLEAMCKARPIMHKLLSMSTNDI
ncbi:hypothetical protein ACB092_09G162100 [Castanea dentata]